MKLPTSIRARISFASSIISVVAMLAIVLASAYFTKSILADSIAATTARHLDVLQVELEAGTRDLSIEGTGAELIQVIDENGTILASSHWAKGVSAISGGEIAAGETRETTVQDMQLERGAVLSAEVSSAEVGQADGGSVAGSSTDVKKISTNVYDAARGDDDDEDDDGEDVDDDRDDASNREDADDDHDDIDDADERRDGARANSHDESRASDGAAGNILSAANPFAVTKAYEDEPTAGSASEINASSLLGADGPFLLIERGITTPSGVVTAAALVSIAPAYEAARVIAIILGSISILTVTCVAWLSWYMASRTLRPVISMREEVEAIEANDLHKRLRPLQGDPDLLKLANTFNSLLERVNKAITEQKRFISDASHELKSPVTATRIMLETAREHPDAVDVAALHEDLASENERMGSIVGNLLLLAQHDEGMPRLEKHPIDLCDLLYEEAAALKVRSSIEIDVSGVQPNICSADATALRHAVRNLLDNAARYARSVVKISSEEAGDYVRIIVSDDGPGIPAADRERVFGRFVRLEEGRCRQKGSTGLGLAVVRTIAEQHGGAAYFVESDSSGAVAVFEISV